MSLPVHPPFETPILLETFFFAKPLILLLLPLVITFLPPNVILFTPQRQTNERTNQRMNERTNERTNGNSFFLTSYSPFAHHY
jgi:hypothetical protein